MTTREEVGCIGKQTYKSKAEALEQQKLRLKRVKSMRCVHKDKRRGVNRLQPYHCPLCHHWHLGSINDGEKMR